MRLDNMLVVTKREYLQRIRTKGFWIGTLILPLFLVAATVLPTLLLSRSESRQKVVVVDETGKLAATLQREVAADERDERKEAAAPDKARGEDKAGGEKPEERRRRNARFDLLIEPPAADHAAQRRDLDRRVLDEKIDAWIWISPQSLTENKVEYHAKSVSNFLTQEVLERHLSEAVRQVRLRDAGLDPVQVGRLTHGVDLSTQRVSEEGSRAEGGLAGAAFAYILFLMLYMMITLWGQQVMTGVLEEKGTRIIEVLVSTVKPLDLMLGKLVGICMLGLTQLGIWMTLLLVITGPGMLAAMAGVPAEVTLPNFTLAMAFNFVLLFALGFFVFATFYAAVGAAFNNLQEAQQVAGILVFFLVLPLFVAARVINDSDSTLAVAMSLVPIFAPLVMALRVAIQMPPVWQLLLCYALLLAFIAVMVWVCARVYRVGILMYGKKPTVQEIWRWIRYA
jgi:ABC-2 type transport system permease protein